MTVKRCMFCFHNFESTEELYCLVAIVFMDEKVYKDEK